MQTNHLLHKHGGRITELSAVAHNTFERQAYWFFNGRIEWKDGTVSELTEISPICLCRGEDDAAAKAELDTALAALNDYLDRNGEWTPNAWKPKTKCGREALP